MERVDGCEGGGGRLGRRKEADMVEGGGGGGMAWGNKSIKSLIPLNEP